MVKKIDTKTRILKLLKRKKTLTTAELVNQTGFSRVYINRFLRQLREEGKIMLIGKANKAHYISANAKEVAMAKSRIIDFRRMLVNKNLLEDAVLSEIKKQTGIFQKIPKNIQGIIDYGFSEMLNNAIEHSKSKKIEIKMARDKKVIYFNVIDYGIGIFKNIMKKKGLANELEAIQDLLKGKQTTAPMAHTGEGIFFTSKVADMLVIRSSKKKLTFNNILKDVFIEDSKTLKGTQVVFSVGLKAKTQLNDVFRHYSDKNSFEFNKTAVIIKLYRMDTNYISRSQARRVLTGLEAFKTITLDFKDVNTIGQAFTDEVFRVWKSNHPDIKIIYINANENIEFMIKRAIALKD